MTHTFKLSRRTARFRATSLALLPAVVIACDSATEPVAPPATEHAAPSFAVSSSSISISNISVRSGKTYRVGWGLGSGDAHYIDRSYTFTSPIPNAAEGLAYIRTANDDKDAYPGSTSFLSFDISTDAIIYVGHDNRLSRPSWLTSNFQDTGLDLGSTDGGTTFSLFKRSYSAGRVTLGSNVTTESRRSMYIVLVQPTTSTTSSTISYSTASGDGIPFGHFHLPNSQFGSLYDGALRNIWPEYLLSNLASIKSRDGKVMLNLAGHRKYYTNSDGTFNLTKWKARVDKFRSINFSSYVKDGTVIGHYLVDEPNCAGCYGGKTIPPSTIEAMAKYSKAIWPSMVTIVRTYPDYLSKWSGTYYYLDAAWAQYVYRKGDVSDFISQNVSLAKGKGLALIVGLNFLRGGPDGSKMTPSQIKSWGATLLSNSYPCAFVSWQYDSNYLSRSDVKSAMYYLRDKAKGRSFKTCRGS